MSEEKYSLNEILSQNLHLIYTARKQNIEEFSSELGIGHTTLQNIFHHKSNLTLDTLDMMAGRLRVSPLLLLSQQYTPADLECSVLLLETLELFQPLTPEKRKEAAALFCRLLELISAGNVNE